jgi:hypothetical protein
MCFSSETGDNSNQKIKKQSTIKKVKHFKLINSKIQFDYQWLILHKTDYYFAHGNIAECIRHKKDIIDEVRIPIIN